MISIADVNMNVVIDMLALFVLITIRLCEKRDNTDISYKKLFTYLWITICGVLALDIPAWILDGKLFDGSRTLCYILDTLYYLFQIVFCYLWMLFSVKWCGFISKKSIWTGLLTCPAAIEIVLILLNPFTEWIFTISAENVYSRSAGYVMNLLPYYFYIVGALGFVIAANCKNTDVIQKKQASTLVIYMFLPILGTILESVYYGISLIWPFTALCLLMVNMNVQQQLVNAQRLAITEKEKEVIEGRMAIMLSQIQPHFMYNTLGTIKILCRKNPPRAEQALQEFTEFLRGNIDSLSDEKLIPFVKELSHTGNYLELEKMRFAERLKVIWDIQTSEFDIPTLTLQPIVENAVHYGITPKQNGGTITIATRKEAGYYVVSVMDDGAGFSMDKSTAADGLKQKHTGRSHIGMSNVSARLQQLCGGRLEFSSIPGQGTTVNIMIPYEQQ